MCLIDFLRKKWYVLFLFFLSLFSLFNLFYDGIYTAHDIWHNLARLNYYFQALKEGEFPPYYLSNLAFGFGYPLFLFSYHLPWIFGSLLMFLGLSDVSVIKILFFFSFFLSGLSMYYLAFDISRKKSLSLVASIIYLWAPYRFFVIFISAAVGVSFTFIFIPLIFLGLFKIYKEDFIKGSLIFIIGFSGTILSHFPTLIVFMPSFLLLLFYFLSISQNKKIFLKYLFFSSLVSLGISSFYLIPAIYYKNYILGLPSIFSMGFVTLKQLIYSRWGFGIIVDSASENPFSFQIGIAQWVVFVFSVLFLLFKLLKSRKFFGLIFVLVFAFILNIFLATSHSSFIWEKFISKAGVDFPFRFIYPSMLLASLLFISITKEMKNKLFYRLFVLFIVLIAFYTNRNHIHPNMFLSESEFRPFVQSESTTSTYNEYLPQGSNLISVSKGESERILTENKTALVSESARSSKYKILFDGERKIILPKFDYPFLEVLIDGVRAEKGRTKGNLLEILVPKGSSNIELFFRRTIVINLSLFTTLLSLFVFLILIWKNMKQGNVYEK